MAGKYRRIPTSIDALNDALGGGLQTFRLVAFGGAPGGSKTTLALDVARGIAAEGRAVVHFVAADEPREGVISRLAQMRGQRRADLEHESPETQTRALAAAADALRALDDRFVIWDQDADRVSIEAVARDAKAHARELGLPLLFVIDSLHSARFESDATIGGDGSRKMTIDARMLVLRALRDPNTCVLVISELNRGAYSGQGARPDLGSFKDSGGIEYQADAPFTIERVKDEPGVIEVRAQKNRINAGAEALASFRLRRLPDCTFATLTRPSAESGAAAKARAAAEALQEAKSDVLALLAGNPQITTVVALAKELGMRKALATDAVKELRREGRIAGGGGEPFRACLVPVEEPAPAEDSDAAA